MRKTAVSPNFKAHQLGFLSAKFNFLGEVFFFENFISVIFIILTLLSLTDEP